MFFLGRNKIFKKNP